MLLEKALHVALKKLNIPHKHNPFDKRYADKEGKGCDVEILSNKGKIGIEAKNNNGKYGMSPYWLNRECHSRFKLEHIIKIFLCAFLTISPRTSEKMKAMGYYLIELGFKVTKENFGRAIHKLIRKLYWIKRSFCFHARPRLLPMSSRESKLTINLPHIVSNTDIHHNHNTIMKIKHAGYGRLPILVRYCTLINTYILASTAHKTE